MQIDLQFAWVPPGSFLMGPGNNNDEPVHRVILSQGFYMGMYPVTQASRAPGSSGVPGAE